uniref:Uncharacterized protein n=1 Tax=Timema shepardi TaxID=629360 RepID=A0A7R9BAD6_TIMSH|nr:unnamed protein product [Timema shepardi]
MLTRRLHRPEHNS